MSPLTTVEATCGMVQQEEAQQEIFVGSKEEHDVLAMTGRKQDLKCHNCGKTGHNQDTCWACKVCGKSGHATDNCWWIKGFSKQRKKGEPRIKGKSRS
ncbi:Gag-Pol polyprotein [Bienertia sinuspersici]